MQIKQKVYLAQSKISNDSSNSSQHPSSTKPIHSPSPDHHSSNVITPTRSPQLMDIKRNLTPVKNTAKHAKILQQIELLEMHQQAQNQLITQANDRHPILKPYQTRYNEPCSSYDHIHHNIFRKSMLQQRNKSTQVKNIWSTSSKGESTPTPYAYDHPIPAHLYIPSQFQSTYTASQPSQLHNQQTAETMASNYSLQLDYIKLLKQKQQAIRQLHQIIQMINRNNNLGEQQLQLSELKIKLQQYSTQIRILMIQNQKLISVIEHNHANVGSNREEILLREIRELRQTIDERDKELEEVKNVLVKKMHLMEQNNRELETQNQKLIKIIKEKQEVSKSRQSSNSSSSNSLPPKAGLQKQKLTLIKIRQQYSENIKLIRQNIVSEMQQLFSTLQQNLQTQQGKTSALQQRVANLQHLKSQLQSRLRHDRIIVNNNTQHQEIETVMLEKYGYYEQQIYQQKVNNEKLCQQLLKAQQSVSKLRNQLSRVKQQTARREASQRILCESSCQIDPELMQQTIYMKQLKIKYLETSLSELEFSRTKEIKKLTEKIEVLKIQKQDCEGLEQARYNKKVTRLQEQYSEKQKQLKQQLQQAVKQLNDFKTDTELKVFELLEIHEKEVKALKAQNAARLSTEESQESQAIDKLKNITTKLTESEAKYQECYAKYRQIDSKYRESDSKYRESDTRRKQLQNRCKDLQNMVLTLQNQHKQLQDTFHTNQRATALDKQTSQRAHAQLSADLQQLMLQLSQKQKDITQLDSLLTNTNIQVNDCQVKIAQIDNQKMMIIVNSQQKIQQMKISLTTRAEQSAQLRGQLQHNRQQLQHTNEQLQHTRNQLQRIHSSFDSICQQLQRYKHQISILRQIETRMSQAQHWLKNSQLIEVQFTQLRNMLSKYLNIINHGHFQNTLIDQYQQLSLQFQLKINQNQKLLLDASTQKQSLNKSQQQKCILRQKISLLQNNTQIYQRQLCQRRDMMEKLAVQKCKAEKELLMYKRVRMEQDSAEERRKSGVIEIQRKIERLLFLESERQKAMKVFVEGSFVKYPVKEERKQSAEEVELKQSIISGLGEIL